MTNLVRKTLVKVVCDTYTCRNMAEFEIGHEAQRALCSHYCKECMEEIVKDASKMLDIKEKYSSVPENDTQTYDIELNEKEESEERPEVVEEPEEEKEYYTCKYCGERFPKPEGLSEYRSHVMKCMRENRK